MKRCAIYTRKSSSEGLQQGLNSLDAQRQFYESYVSSQAGEGWEALPARYDDGGFSGGSLDRPAVRRLMDDVAAGGIDVVVVYKIDRLSRSLIDFSSLIGRFETHGVSFVAVTQAFNTTSSMGRLTLNVLLSFAQFETRARAAHLRHPASVEDVDYRAHRGLDRALFLKLAGCDWIRTRRNLVITGPCGVGKSWLACALGQKACREDLSVLYYRVPRLFAALSLARGDGRYAKLLKQLARAKLLVLDDWGPEPLTAEQARDLLEIVEDRYDAGSVLITSQVPVDRWYEMIGTPTLADAVLDRLIHNAYRIELSGDSLRKHRPTDQPA